MAENLTGSVCHDILNYFFTEIKKTGEKLSPPTDTERGGLTLPSDYRKLLEKGVNTVFDNFSSKDMSALTARLLRSGKNDFTYHLENCLSRFLSYFAGCHVIESETWYELNKDTFILNGRIDCVLKDPTKNKYIIIDFKFKTLPESADYLGEGENGITDFQLPMYITLTEENEKIEVYTALFYSILENKCEVMIGSIRDMYTGKEIPKKEEDRIIRGEERYNEILRDFNEKTEQFSQEMLTGNFTVFESKNANCRECSYQRICRAVYIIKGND
jgi:hypothetical protein